VPGCQKIQVHGNSGLTIFLFEALKPSSMVLRGVNLYGVSPFQAKYRVLGECPSGRGRGQNPNRHVLHLPHFELGRVRLVTRNVLLFDDSIT